MSANIKHITTGDFHTGKMQRRSADPLEQFVDAKKAMGDTYQDLKIFIADLHNIYTGWFEFNVLRLDLEMNNEKELPKNQMAEIEKYRDVIDTIIEMFTRDKMKVVFFGRTSNGKSSVINAMLHSKILPQGMGHTTCCFLSVEGGSENEKYFMTEEEKERFPIAELNTVGHALSSGNSTLKEMGQDSLLRVFYPKSASKLLQNDVVFVDSPGVDLSPAFDSWIDKHCIDADVFVLVCNAESTLTQAEKNFFLRVSAKLSRPNVFILNNRWDASASEDENHREQVRTQHRTRFIQFLADELKVCSKEEAENRFFFVSAREMLESRLKAKGDLENAYQVDGFQRRAMEFSVFENIFEKTISKSAINTKFEAHAKQASDIIQNLGHNIDTVKNSTIRERQRLVLDSELKSKELKECREKFALFEKNYVEQQQTVRAEVHLKVAADFVEEVRRLESIIDCFDDRFVDDKEHIKQFKQNLISFIEKKVTANLEEKCTGGLMARIWSLENQMFQNVQAILGTNYAAKLEQPWQYKQPFKFNIIVDCRRLLEDFNEDLEFHFSFGIDVLLRRFIAFYRGRPITSLSRDPFAAALNYPQFQPNSTHSTAQQEQELIMAEVIRLSASYLANGTVGALVVGTMVYKSVGWKTILTAGALYGGLYAIERLRWNSAAKEQHLKEQMRSHLAVGMRQISGFHTAQCEAQVTRELEQAHHGLKIAVTSVQQEMKQTCDTLKETISTVDETIKTLNGLKGRTNFIQSGVNAFYSKFLTSTN